MEKFLSNKIEKPELRYRFLPSQDDLASESEYEYASMSVAPKENPFSKKQQTTGKSTPSDFVYPQKRRKHKNLITF
jgi:hypothetical protein